jgi:hypothetical protein
MASQTARIAEAMDDDWLVSMDYVETLGFENNIIESYLVQVTSLRDGRCRDSYEFTSATEANEKLQEMEHTWLEERGEDKATRADGHLKRRLEAEGLLRPMELFIPKDPYADNPDFGLF